MDLTKLPSTSPVWSSQHENFLSSTVKYPQLTPRTVWSCLLRSEIRSLSVTSKQRKVSSCFFSGRRSSAATCARTSIESGNLRLILLLLSKSLTSFNNLKTAVNRAVYTGRSGTSNATAELRFGSSGISILTFKISARVSFQMMSESSSLRTQKKHYSILISRYYLNFQMFLDCAHRSADKRHHFDHSIRSTASQLLLGKATLC